jgi:hypothetical protein
VCPDGGWKTENRTGGAAIVIRRLSPSGLVISFHDVKLSVQQASRFSLECSVDLDNATIQAAPDRLCICANYFYKPR